MGPSWEKMPETMDKYEKEARQVSILQVHFTFRLFPAIPVSIPLCNAESGRTVILLTV
jgi:hypothetical protein